MALSTNSRRLTAASGIPPSARRGRWLSSPTESLSTSWSSSCLEFFYTGSKLTLCVGQNTERKDKNNGGTPMLAIQTGSTAQVASQDPTTWKTFDPQPGSDILIFDQVSHLRHTQIFVRIVMIDWASNFEVDAIVLDEDAYITSESFIRSGPVPRVLVIGDSITAGLAVPVNEGGEPLPFGTLNTFPFAAERILNENTTRTSIEMSMISYPGMCLVPPTKEEKEKGQRDGMLEVFFWDSPWSHKGGEFPSLSPSAVIIELGTNDQFFNIPSERFSKALVDFIKALREWTRDSIKHVWLIPPFPDTDTTNRELNIAMPQFIQTLEETYGEEIAFKICDLPEGLTANDTVDGVHPRLYVHEILGEKLAQFIETNLLSTLP
ncbi:hypothetical protein D9613_011150 [Agrocybe pediades]|uniref:SGNH hydrolase-type esterase domain-containing protein n=1 Tax=Agrocybe pediades TaxID=84607 RepID=A0A8H4QL87_9AGAR|nr:hypothetical protein D9613_011150 [Agrocybe pediades]